MVRVRTVTGGCLMRYLTTANWFETSSAFTILVDAALASLSLLGCNPSLAQTVSCEVSVHCTLSISLKIDFKK